MNMTIMQGHDFTKKVATDHNNCHGQGSVYFKGTMSRDFQASVSENVLNMDSFSRRYSTTDIDSAQYCIARSRNQIRKYFFIIVSDPRKIDWWKKLRVEIP
jgi:hypothetical protein